MKNIFQTVNIFSAGDTGVLKHNFRDCGRSELIRTFNFEEKVRITVEQWHSRKQLDSRVIVWRIAHDQLLLPYHAIVLSDEQSYNNYNNNCTKLY